MGWVLILLPLLAVPFSNTKEEAIPAYLLTFAAFLALSLLYKVPIIKKRTFAGVYISFSVLFLLGIYLSVIHSPNMRATILLGGFILMPLSFIDRLPRTIEEFMAIAYGYEKEELFSIAESLRVAVQKADMDGYNTTVSIGVAYCGEEQVTNYEKVIERADNAAYSAKRSGRNKVCMEQTR